VWTANEPRLLRRLSGDPRVAAVITDRPERAIAAAGRSTAVPPAADTP
jgi:hypothetical protein